MDNNQVFKRLLNYLLIRDQIRDYELMEFFRLGGLQTTRSYLKAIRSSIDDKDYKKLTDENLDIFFNGLISFYKNKRNKA